MIIKKILIISHSYDLHVDLLTSVLDGKGHPYFRINLDCFPRDYQITHQFTEQTQMASIVNLSTGDKIEVNEIGATWVRKPAEFTYINDLSAQEAEFAKQETEQVLFGVIYSSDCFWMSHPIDMRGAMWKTEQLHRAQKMGFKVPNTLVSNAPEAVHRFKQKISGELIYKTLSSPTLAAENVQEQEVIASSLPTTIITEEMSECIDAVSELPCQFQEYVEKEYELRVTIIGDRVFATRINSQEDSRTAVDCRDMSAEISYQATELPEIIKTRCLAFMRSYNLNYSAIDIIVTKEGDYVFLENNPNGQFLYIEQLVPEFNLIEVMAEVLIKEARC